MAHEEHPRWREVQNHLDSTPSANIGDEPASLLLDFARVKLAETQALYAHLEARRWELLKFEAVVVAGYFAIAKANEEALDWAGAVGALFAFLSIGILLASGWTRSVASSPDVHVLRERFHATPALGEEPKAIAQRKDALAASLAETQVQIDAACRGRAIHLNAATALFLVAVAAYGLSLLLGTRG